MKEMQMLFQRVGVITASVLAAAALASPASAASDSAGCVGQFSSYFAHGGAGVHRSQLARQFAREDRPAGLNVYSHVAEFHGSLGACFDQT
jgi:hypothetical protein